MHVFDTGEALAQAAADFVAARLAEAIAARGRATLALSGGTTPGPLYRRLAGEPGAVDWARVHIFFADERAVPPTDPDSNFRLARETLIDPAMIPPPHVHRMRAEFDDLEAVAVEYEARLPTALDVIVLGIGADGHTASLFPGSPLTAEPRRRVAPVLDSPKPPSRRVTLTARALGEARAIVVLASGADKAAAVARALAGDATPLDLPARLVRDRDWFLDRAAAAAWSRIESRGPTAAGR